MLAYGTPDCRLRLSHLAPAMPAIITYAILDTPRAGISADRPVDQPLLPGKPPLLLRHGGGTMM